MDKPTEEAIRKRFDRAVDASAGRPLWDCSEHELTVRDVLGWVLGEYQSEP